MKLDQNSCIEYFRKNKEDIFERLPNDVPPREDQELISLLEIDSKSKYVFSNSVKETLDTIRIKDEFDLNILKKRKSNSGVLIVSRSEFYIFQEFEEKLRVFNYLVSSKEKFADLNIFTFNLKSNKKIISEDFEENTWKKFLQCMIYLDFLPTEIKYIEPNGKYGTRKEGKVLNKTDDTIIYITKAWNQEYKTKPGVQFFSKPHFGIRWTGEGRETPKLVWVKGSFKQLNKKAEKELKQ